MSFCCFNDGDDDDGDEACHYDVVTTGVWAEAIPVRTCILHNDDFRSFSSSWSDHDVVIAGVQEKPIRGRAYMMMILSHYRHHHGLIMMLASQAFEKNQYVVGQERKELAKNLNLSETQVQNDHDV